MSSGNEISNAGPQDLQDYASFDDIPDNPTVAPKGGESETKDDFDGDQVMAEGAEEAEEVETPDEEVVDDATEEKTETKSKKRTVKAKEGEKEVEIPLDAVVTRKVDGQTKQFTLEQILNGFSGDLAVERRMNEANTIKQEGVKLVNQTRQERAELVGGFKKVGELISEGKTNEGMMHFAKILGQDPMEFIATLQESIDKVVEQYRDMDPEEYKASRARTQNELFRNFNKSQREEAQRADAEKAARAEVTAEVDSACEKWGVTKEEIDAELEVCKVEQAYGRLPKDFKLTAEFLAHRANRVKLVGRIKGHIPKFFPNRVNDMKFVNELLSDVVSNPDFTEADWLKMAEGAKKMRETNLQKKVGKKILTGSEARKSVATNSKLGKTAQGVESIDRWNFDDI